MRRALYLALLFTLSSGSVWAEGESASCGDNHVTCGEVEKCCEHVVAYYSPQGVQGASHVEGECIQKADKCNNFWCGPQHCEAGFWGTPKVCCVDPRSGASPDYQCARTELNCPGNTQLLTIRDAHPNNAPSRAAKQIAVIALSQE